MVCTLYTTPIIHRRCWPETTPPVFILFLLTVNETNPFSLDVKLLLGSERRFHLKPVMMFTVSYDPLCGSFESFDIRGKNTNGVKSKMAILVDQQSAFSPIFNFPRLLSLWLPVNLVVCGIQIKLRILPFPFFFSPKKHLDKVFFSRCHSIWFECLVS